MTQTGFNKTPPASIVLPHFAFASLAFLILTILMYFSSESFIGHYFNPKLLAITHIATLGWASMIIFGSLYQLIPVLLNTEIFSLTIAKFTFLFFSAGIPLLVYSFWTFSIGLLLQTAASILLIGATLFLINIIATAKKNKEISTEAELIVSSTIWFWATVFVGVLMAFNFTYIFLPKEHLYFLKIHAHIGIGGWFILLIMGASSKLIPMFMLSQNLNQKKIKYASNLVNIAILGFIIDSIFFNGINRGIIYFSIAILGISFYISFIIEAYKKRARKSIDINIKQSLVAVIIIIIPAILGLIIHSNTTQNTQMQIQATMVYGVSIFLGFISLLILGQTYKTLPFIVWLHKYKKQTGKKQTPLPKNMYSEKLVKYQFVFFSSGFFILLLGIIFSKIIIIKTACILLIITAIIYNINVFIMLFHRPKMLD